MKRVVISWENCPSLGRYPVVPVYPNACNLWVSHQSVGRFCFDFWLIVKYRLDHICTANKSLISVIVSWLLGVCQSNHFFKTQNKAKCNENSQIFNISLVRKKLFWKVVTLENQHSPRIGSLFGWNWFFIRTFWN